MIETDSTEKMFATWAGAWGSGAGTLQRQMLGFVADRLEKDGRAIRGAIESGSVSDAVTIHSQWLAETVQDYMAEAVKLASLMTDGSAFPQLSAATLSEVAPQTEAPASRRTA